MIQFPFIELSAQQLEDILARQSSIAISFRVLRRQFNVHPKAIKENGANALVRLGALGNLIRTKAKREKSSLLLRNCLWKFIKKRPRWGIVLNRSLVS